MKKQHLRLGVILCMITLLLGCRKDLEPLAAPDATLNRVESTSRLTPAQRAKLARLKATLPKGYEKRVNSKLPRPLLDPQYRDMARKAMAVTPTACDASTPMNQWLDRQLADWDEETFFYVLITGMLDMPTVDALLFSNSAKDQYFGTDGDFTQRINKTTKDLRRFWDIPSDNIVVVGMHGNMLRNRERLIRADQVIYGDSREAAEFWADLILELLKIIPQYRNGDHPIFTFNAFAQESFRFPPYGTIPDKIVMGDGILEALAAVGYGDVAPQAVLAHEFGHHIQFELKLFKGSGPEATRRTELMADAYAAYYLSHARGASMQWKRVQQFLKVFFNIGDCEFTSAGHHGTPAQRMAAARWAYSVADNAHKQGHILSSRQFTAMFEKQLPRLVAN